MRLRLQNAFPLGARCDLGTILMEIRDETMKQRRRRQKAKNKGLEETAKELGLHLRSPEELKEYRKTHPKKISGISMVPEL